MVRHQVPPTRSTIQNKARRQSINLPMRGQHPPSWAAELVIAQTDVDALGSDGYSLLALSFRLPGNVHERMVR